MSQRLDYGTSTHVGLVRTNNEDNFLADPDLGLWLIADGMGGHEAGEVASQLVIDYVAEAVKNHTPLVDAIAQSHFEVKEAVNRNIGKPNMGTTIVALSTKKQQYQVAWVGDSRAYLWDPHKHNIQQISKDHSYVQSLVDSGALKKEAMQSHPQKNIITQSLGVSALESVIVDTFDGHWQTGQKIVLCSDGLSDLVTDAETAHIIRQNQHKSDQQIADLLVQMALKKGGIDNVTVEVISAPEEITPTSRINQMLGSLHFALSASALVLVIIFWLAYK